MKILFLSGLDFKERSIQVIEKTPVAYAQRGWEVTYVVAREMSRKGNYYYEPLIDPPGVKVVRTRYVLKWLRERTNGLLYKSAVQCDHWLTAIRLGWNGMRENRRHGPFDVIYGYESCGVLAAAFVRTVEKLTRRRRKQRTNQQIPSGRPTAISRFQGVWNLNRYAKQKRYVRLAFQSAWVCALYLPSDLCIMTNDGSQGTELLQRLRSRNKNVLHLVNGVDPPAEPTSPEHQEAVEKALAPHVHGDDTVILVVSRLVGYKRADRSIRILQQIVRQAPDADQAARIKLVIVGGGAQQEELEQLAAGLGIADQVVFTGAVPHGWVTHFLKRADYFFSFYHFTNVGNPLLEAIRHHKIIFTADNGDTSTWITPGDNGFLFDEDDSTLPREAAATFWRIHQQPLLCDSIRRAVEQTARNKLWTWEERMNAELDAVEQLRAA